MQDVLTNPTVQGAVAYQTSLDPLVRATADSLMSHTTWGDMNPEQRKLCLRAIVLECSTENELRRRLHTDLGLDHPHIAWEDISPDDVTGQEARAFVKALGGLVSKSGALVMISAD